jgi:uncharacterized membrane protein YdjX (TVP38/TMEM64 family)
MTFITPYASNLVTSAGTAEVPILNFLQLPTAVSTALPNICSVLSQSSFPDVSTLLLTTIPDPLTIVSTIIIVTASDMIPFVPCQPLAMTLGATLGIWAFPICVVGQTLAGIFAFQLARAVADADGVQKVLDTLGDEAKEKFQEFRQLGTTEKEGAVFLALIGLRLAPFFPFSAGNYLLGGATGVGLKPFFLATVLGCLLSNFLSVSVGMGGIELLRHSQ